MDHLRRTFVWTLPLAFLVVGVGGWLVAGRALKPLRAIAETARKVTATGLDQRIPQSHESPEIRRVIEMLNHMMDRLEKSFRQATRFSADASHELKTPLAIMQGELENALQSAPPGSSEQQLCNTLLEEVQRLKTITRSLLLLAQADAGQLKLAVDDVNLSAEVEGLLEDAKVLAGDKRLSFEETIPANVVAQGDRALLRTAMLNLVSNAVKYAEPGGRVKVALALEDGQLVLSIGNTGSGIPPEETLRLFSRFHRVHREGEARVEGMGLGLSLAREIARAHRGDVVLKESRAGWTCFELRLPGVSAVGRGSGANGD
jgi:heavy metal sensor kinase